MAEASVAHIWPEWQIEEQLGKGSYGTVFRAVRKDSNLTTYSAIKIISIPQDPSELDTLRSEGLTADESQTYLQGIVDNFVNEIQLMQSFKGTQNSVSIEDYKVTKKIGTIGWKIYIRMELLTPLPKYCASRPMTEQEVIRLGCDICTALELCARRNIIHRDIKPDNIFLNDFGSFKLGDFGIARTLSGMTSGMSQKGTPFYMAPEVFVTNKYDARVDICSLGLVMYKLLNRDLLPFIRDKKQLLNPNERDIALERRRTGETMPPPCDASPAMAHIILKACAYDPNDRFANASELKAALMSAANGTYRISGTNPNHSSSVRRVPDPGATSSVRQAGVQTPETPPRGGSFTPKKKSKAPGILAACLVTALLAGGAWLAYPRVMDILSGGTEENSVTGTADPAEETHDTAVYSSFDEERIDAILADAEALADADDLTGAVTAVQTGLVTYPKSAELQEKLEEYTNLLTVQAKNQILAEAASFADSGNYPAALAVLENAQTESPEEEDYRTAHAQYLLDYEADTLRQAEELSAAGNYEEAIGLLSVTLQILPDSTALNAGLEDCMQKQNDKLRSEALLAADAQAQANDYLGALVTLNQAIQTLGEDEELSAAVTAYEEAYAQSVALQNTPAAAEPSAAVTLTAAETSNPNQNAVQPSAGEDVDVVSGTSFDGACEVSLENINHTSFQTENSVGWYKITTSANFSSYRFELRNNSVDSSVYITVYDQYQQELGSAGAGISKSAYVDLTLEANTTYWIKFSRYYQNRLGNYQFTVSEKICDAGTGWNSAFTVGQNTKYTKELDTAHINDWFTFTTGTSYSVCRLEAMNNSIDSSTYFTVYDEYETELGSVGVSRGKTEYLDLALAPQKQYYLRISRYYQDRLGNYQFTLHEKVCDAGLTQESAFPLTVGQTQYGTLDTTYNDWYVCTVPETADYTITFTNNNIDSTTYLTIYDMLGTELYNIGTGMSKTNSFTQTVEKGTVLYMRISRYYKDRLGNYTLTLSN